MVLVLRDDVVYVPEPDSEVLGVTEATGICGMEAEENVEYEDAQEVMGEDEEVTGEFFSRLGEFSHALRADSIFSVRSTVAGETVLRLELCCRVSRRGRGNEWGRATFATKLSSILFPQWEHCQPLRRRVWCSQ